MQSTDICVQMWGVQVKRSRPKKDNTQVLYRYLKKYLNTGRIYLYFVTTHLWVSLLFTFALKLFNYWEDPGRNVAPAHNISIFFLFFQILGNLRKKMTPQGDLFSVSRLISAARPRLITRSCFHSRWRAAIHVNTRCRRAN